MISWALAAFAGPPPGLDLDDLDQWPLDAGLFDEADACWEIEGSATFTDRVGPWSREGTATLRARFADGRFEQVTWTFGELVYDTADGGPAGVFDDRPVALQLWAERDDPERAEVLGTRRGRRLARRIDALGRSGGVVTTSARWDDVSGQVLVRESWPLGGRDGAPRLDRVLGFPGGAPPAHVERWTLDGTKLFPSAPFSPPVRLQVLETEVVRRADVPVPAREHVRHAVSKLGLTLEHEHVVTYGAPTPCAD